MTEDIITVVVVRHPDSEDQIEVDAPLGMPVRVVYADLGSSFDGRPRCYEEAEVAQEVAARLDDETSHLPDASKARALAVSWAETLRDDASQYLTEQES